MEIKRMKTNRFTLMFISMLVALATLLAACAPAAAPTAAPATEAPAVATEAPTEAATEAPTEPPAPVTIQYWHTHSDPETAQLDKVIAAFETANPGIKVETTRYAYNDYKTALLTAISSGDVPDVARLDIAWVSFHQLMEGSLLRPAVGYQHTSFALEQE
jgi:ABC-type glycerol-3-phosphate transport system substrate-binding protein